MVFTVVWTVDGALIVDEGALTRDVAVRLQMNAAVSRAEWDRAGDWLTSAPHVGHGYMVSDADSGEPVIYIVRTA